MFHLYQPDHIEWPVSVDLPAKGGVKKAYKFTAHFRVLDQEDCQEAEDAMTAPLPCSYQDLADAVLCGWGEEVVDEAGEPVEFNDVSKARFYRIQGAAAAVFNAWTESLGTPTEKSAAKAGGFRAKN
jgi:hypothetical protein